MRRTKMNEAPVECRRDGVVMCVYHEPSQTLDKEIYKAAKAAGYKFYQNGKIYKPESKQIQYKINLGGG